MQKDRKYVLTLELLLGYQEAALKNASELLEEAQLLLLNVHYARAYFLAVASIEETGKAYLAFDARGRNLSDGGLCKKIKENFEDHPTKIMQAFICWIISSNSPNKIREEVQAAIDQIINLKHGREKSMYIDVKEDTQVVSAPAEVVRPIAAKDCVTLASHCLHYTKKHIELNVPLRRTPAQDKLLCLKQNTYRAILSMKDFWEFYISELEKDGLKYDEAVVTYHDGYYHKKKMFKQEAG